jgi:D-tyrosyl-tRNA(Tyr) deacylase
MKTVVQRVSSASVSIKGKVVGSIGKGLLVLAGFGKQEIPENLDWMARKLVGLRIFGDDEGKMNRSLLDVGGAVLVVSQFTLYGDARKGNRPSFVRAGDPTESEELYHLFMERLRSLGAPVQAGVFGADMQVSLLNDGPVTLLIERGEDPQGT